MSTRFAMGALVALLVLGCSGGSGPAPTPTPGGGAPTPVNVPTATPGGAPTPGGGATVPPGGGNLEAKARSLVPAGSTQTAEFDGGTSYVLTVTTTTPIAQLEAFWEQAIPAAGLSLSGSFTFDGALVMAFTNPDGGITATPGENGLVTVLISIGTSS